MGVEAILELQNDGSLVKEVRERWSHWAKGEPTLQVVDGFDDLREWLKSAEPDDADSVLIVLAMLAAADGGNDRLAAAALAKCLLPGVIVRARQIHVGLTQGRWPGAVTESPETIDAMVAAQLWIAVCSFPWRRLRRVASNIVWSVHNDVLGQLGVHRANKTDTVKRVVSLDDQDRTQAAQMAAPQQLPDAIHEVTELLEWACESQVISLDERRMIEMLLIAGSGSTVPRKRRGRGGLLASATVGPVAAEMGVSPVTVERRAGRAMDALIQAAPYFVAGDVPLCGGVSRHRAGQ